MRRTLQLLAALIVVLGLAIGCTDGGQQQEAAGNGSTSGDQPQETTGNEAKQQETIGSETNPQEAEKSTGTKPLTGCVRDASNGRAPRQEAKNEDPNGRIAFAADEDYADESVATDIYVMNVDGTDRTRLTNSELMELSPSWSPDGKKIAFTGGKEALFRQTEDPESFGTYVMNANGTALTKLADDTSVSIAWSPDGEKIAFSQGGSIYVMNADGTGRTRINTNKDEVYSLDWSPDCKKIAFSAAEGIHVINADGSNLKRLVPEEVTPGVYGGRYYDPAWSPDGRQMDDDGNWVYTDDILVTDADGSGTTNLTNTLEAERTPAWAPGG